MSHTTIKPQKPSIQETLYTAVHNASAGKKLKHNASNFARIALDLGYSEDQRFRVGAPMMHPFMYAPTELTYDVPTHIRGLTSMIANSGRYNTTVRAGELVGMVDVVAQSALDNFFALQGGLDQRPRFIRTGVARSIVRHEVADSIDREAVHGESEQLAELTEIRHSLATEWGKDRQVAQAGAVVGAGLFIALRIRRP